jgi:hypothetical protein
MPKMAGMNILSESSVRVSWEVPSNGGSAITSYEVRYSEDSDFVDGVGACTVSEPSPPDQECTIDGLTLGAMYYVQVRAVNGVGGGAWSVIHAVTAGAPDRPVIEQIDVSAQMMVVSWNAPSGNGANIVNYTLEYTTDSEFSTGVTRVVTTENSYSVSGLVGGTFYYFRVLATNSRGDSPWSDTESAVYVEPPSISSVSPGDGPTSGGVRIKVIGIGFYGVNEVKIGEKDCADFAVVNNMELMCLIDRGNTVGKADVFVANGVGSDTLVDGFEFVEEVTALSFVSGKEEVEISVMYNGGMAVSSHDLVVRTNNMSGYTLTVEMRGDDSALINASTGGRLEVTDAHVTPTALPVNTWGISVTDVNDHWLSVRGGEKRRVLRKTTQITSGGLGGAGEMVRIHFGVNAGEIAPGTYSGTIVYTVVGN